MDQERRKARARKWAQEHREAARQYYQEHKEEAKARSLKRYVEKQAEVRAYNQTYYQANKPKFRQNSRNARKKLRNEVLTHYGNACACCGESAAEFLAIDHIGGGGNKHRRELFKRSDAPSTLIYGWLRREGFPEGFRVLCHNCNLALGFYGYCPHASLYVHSI